MGLNATKADEYVQDASGEERDELSPDALKGILLRRTVIAPVAFASEQE
jgi:hypothetical protein